MKRTILLSSLALSIIGTLSFSIIANIEGNKNLKMTMDYVVGDKYSLGDAEIKQEIWKGDYAKKTLLINKDGIKDEGIKFHFNDEDEHIKDKKLFRGIEGGSFGEDENFSVILQCKIKKGLIVRYKNNEKYKEFTIVNDVIKSGNGRIYNTFVKDGEVYTIYSNERSEDFLIKINLTSENMVESIKMPDDTKMEFVSRDVIDKGYVTRNNKIYIDNKLYMLAFNRDHNIRLFYYDLSSKSLTFKDIDTGIKSMESSMYRFINNKLYFTSCNNKGDLGITSYDMLKDEKKSIDVKFPINEEVRNIYVSEIKETEDFIYLCGGIIDNNDEKAGYIMCFDKRSNSIKYFSKIKGCSRLDYRLMIQ